MIFGILHPSKAIEHSNNESGLIEIGSTVTIIEEGFPEEVIHIVGSKETDPNSGKLSYESPIGSALLKHKVGDIVRVTTPGGSINFKVIKIE